MQLKNKLPILFPFLMVGILTLACATSGNLPLTGGTPGVTPPADVYGAPAGATPGDGLPVGVGPTPTTGTDAAATSAAPTQAGPAATMQQGALPPAASQGVNTNLVSTLLDWELFDPAGFNLGEVDALVADRQSGQILYLLLDPEDTLQPGDGVIAIPWPLVQTTQAAGSGANLTLNLDRQILAGVPLVPDENEATFNNATWDDAVFNYWQGQAGALPGGSSNAQNPTVLVESDHDIRDTVGADIGEIEDMLLSPTESRIVYVFWEPEDVLNTTGALIPVPFEKLRWDPATNDFVLNAAVINALNLAPTVGFAGQLDPSVPGWDDTFRTFWNTQPAP